MGNENYSEKVSVNINSSTLSNIDLLVDNGYYSNRSDFINQAVRASLQQHQSTLDRIIDSNLSRAGENDNWFIGVFGLTAADVEDYYEKGKIMNLRGYGVLVIDSDCDEEKLFAVLKSIRIKGKVFGSASVKQHYKIK